MGRLSSTREGQLELQDCLYRQQVQGQGNLEGQGWGPFHPGIHYNVGGISKVYGAALTHEPRIQELPNDWQRCGYQTFHLPVGVMLNEEQKEQSACIRCSTCDGFPCLVNDKADSQVVCVDPELQYPNVTFF